MNNLGLLQIFTKKLKYMEDYKLIDGRLIICAIAVGAAMFALIWDYLYPFPLSKYRFFFQYSSVSYRTVF